MAYGPRVSSASNINPVIFGDGSDGDVTISALVQLSRDMNYRNLTISGAGTLQTGGVIVRVAGTLDISAAGKGAIYNINHSFSPPFVGGSASGATGGSVTGSSGSGISMPANTGGSLGPTGTTGAGAFTAFAPVPAAAPNTVIVPAGAAGGAGTNAGGAGITAVTTTASLPFLNRFNAELAPSLSFWALPGGTNTAIFARVPGFGNAGSSGGGDGTNLGGGGAQGGGAPGNLVIAANIIKRSSSTVAGAIWSVGGVGGNGGTPPAGNCGGGGAGGGAAGGLIWIIAGSLIGTTATGCIDISGGNGGTGGNGVGTGQGGNGGSGGQTGFYCLHLIGSPAVITAPNTAGTAGGAQVAGVGGTPGLGAVLQVNL